MVYFFFNLMFLLILIIMVLIGVAYITLMERKLLGYVQNRKGPNKVGMGGILQPFGEAIKLFSKEKLMVLNSSNFIFYFFPVLSMFLLMIVWMNYVCFTNIYFLNYSILFIILILSLNSYMIMMMGWSSGSLYAMIGAIRLVAQILSYEVSFILIIFVQMVLSESYALSNLLKWQFYLWYMWMLFPLMVVFFISILAELNRSPMDLIEGESELVSGFNVEYFSGLFALIFLSEYGMIIFMAYLLVMLYMGSFNLMIWSILMMVVMYLIVVVRSMLPRIRYDMLMYLCWKLILPLVLNYLFFFMVFKIVMNFVI